MIIGRGAISGHEFPTRDLIGEIPRRPCPKKIFEETTTGELNIAPSNIIPVFADRSGARRKISKGCKTTRQYYL
jgi:hypothetical protein